MDKIFDLFGKLTYFQKMGVDMFSSFGMAIFSGWLMFSKSEILFMVDTYKIVLGVMGTTLGFLLISIRIWSTWNEKKGIEKKQFQEDEKHHLEKQILELQIKKFKDEQ